jgi:prepilin-type N-terminal cleavage/methylation domain-containing protein
LRRERRARRAGFTLIEALVALALVLAFAAAVGPLMFQARRIMSGAEGRAAAHVLLRSLMEAPFDRSALSQAHQGESQGLRWRVIAEPVFVGVLARRERKEGAAWMPVRVVGTVSWGAGQSLSAETLRLVRVE